MIINNIIITGYDVIIRHICNHSSCVNPNHLIDGTFKENTQDTLITGHLIGSRNPNSFLLEKDIKRIRKLAKYLTIIQISELPEYKKKLKYNHIANIIYYKIWKNIEKGIS